MASKREKMCQDKRSALNLGERPILLMRRTAQPKAEKIRPLNPAKFGSSSMKKPLWGNKVLPQTESLPQRAERKKGPERMHRAFLVP